jgi:tetratricopeptide (TPR) repeat protein
MDILSFKSEIGFNYTDDSDLLEQLKKFYTYNGYTPQIKIDGDIIHVHIDNAVYKATKRDFDKAMAYCNSGDFDKAYPILQSIVEKCPLHSDAFRTLGQIEMERENYDAAEGHVLSALLIDPTNLWALILMGNIYGKQGKVDISEVYYNKVLKYHPDDVLALNNIGANMIRLKRYDEAIDLFEKVIQKDSSYLNSYYGLALCHYNKGDLEKTIEICVEGMKKGINRPQDRSVREEIQKLAMTSAHDYVKGFDYRIEVGIQEKKLSQGSSIPLRIEEDENLPVYARMEYYITRKRDYNRVVYNPSKKYYEHLLMHEFMHLEMYNEASQTSSNKITISGEEELTAFRKWIAPELGKLKSHLPSEHLEKFVAQLHNGLMLQATNSPLDLLVEDRIYKNYPKMRPLQMLSLVEMELSNVDSVTKATKSDIPLKVVSANRIMNMVSAMHLQELYGFNITPHYKPTALERKKADDLYKEYQAYRDDYKPGEEYDLLDYFAETLGLDPFFKMVNEMHFKDLNLPSEEKLYEESIDPESREERNAAFAENHADGRNQTETMMMTMYMLGALKYFDGMPHEDIHRIAIEIAMVGLKGISPDKKGYSINAIPNKEFGGYEFLAYYYVSWALAVPDKVNSLGLPFKTAYQSARKLFESKK